jgi:hypothetical protein
LAVADRNLLGGNKLILNLPTKTYWRLPSEYAYIENGLFALRDYMINHQVESITLPALGLREWLDGLVEAKTNDSSCVR